MTRCGGSAQASPGAAPCQVPVPLPALLCLSLPCLLQCKLCEVEGCGECQPGQVDVCKTCSFPDWLGPDADGKVRPCWWRC